jgi:2-amino-4-hydroxy-6-hydroxymethyldihydropteridine diphosphokinase
VLDAVVGLGANIGPCLETLRSAVASVGRAADVRAVSPVYATVPVGPPQPDYLNAAIRVAWPRGAHALLAFLLAVEADHGRIRTVKWGARTLDLDILWISNLVVNDGDLEVPHPRLHERRFALWPLLDVAPDARDPRTGRPFDRLSSAADGGVRRTELRLT